MNLPIFDMHCDLLSYLSRIPGANAFDKDQIACAIPWLLQGGVRVQVTAIYTDVQPESMRHAKLQADKYQQLIAKHEEEICTVDEAFLSHWTQVPKLGLLASVENAAGLGHEQASWAEIETQFDTLLSQVGKLAYISLTHHTENRFGGGNYTEGIGLKKDGERLLEMISGKKIPIDLSHTSDLLAQGILDCIAKQSLDIPVIASHSNFRTIWNHKRNISDEFVQEIVHRKGLIGINFLRAFLDTEHPERLFEHILYGFETGAADQICFGADYFYTKDFGDPSRVPFYFPLAENAGKYPSLLESLSTELDEDQLRKLAFQNALGFYQKLWN